MINLREHFKLSAIYTLFAAFPVLLQLIVYPVIEGEGRLGAADFGYLAITEAIISVIFIICTFGMSSGLARFYYDYRTDNKIYKKLVSTVISGILGRGMLLMGIAVLFAPFISTLFTQPSLQNFSEYGPALVVSGLNRSVLATMLSLYRNEKRVRIFILVSILSGIMRSGFQLTGVLFYDLSFIGYVYGTAAGGTFVSLGVLIYTYYKCGFHYDKRILANLFPFVRPLFLTDLILWGLLFIDRFFLLKNPGELGIYDNAMKFAIGIQLIIQGLINAIQPQLFRYLNEGIKIKSSEIKTLSNLFLAESIIIIVVAILPVMLFIRLFYETELTLSTGLIMIVFVRFILSAQYQVFALPVMYAKKTRIFFYTNTGALVLSLLLNWLLTPVWGYYGAITAFYSAYFAQVFIFSIIQQRVVPIGWQKKKILYFPMAVVLTAILFEVLKVATGANPFIISTVFVALTLAGLLLLYKKELLDYIPKWR